MWKEIIDESISDNGIQNNNNTAWLAGVRIPWDDEKLFDEVNKLLGSRGRKRLKRKTRLSLHNYRESFLSEKLLFLERSSVAANRYSRGAANLISLLEAAGIVREERRGVRSRLSITSPSIELLSLLASSYHRIPKKEKL
jgi:hypothetical protein